MSKESDAAAAQKAIDEAAETARKIAAETDRVRNEAAARIAADAERAAKERAATQQRNRRTGGGK